MDGYGERVRAARLERRLTLQALGALTGLDRTTLSRIERGERRPTYDTQDKLRAVLGVEPERRPTSGTSDAPPPSDQFAAMLATVNRLAEALAGQQEATTRIAEVLLRQMEGPADKDAAARLADAEARRIAAEGRRELDWGHRRAQDFVTDFASMHLGGRGAGAEFAVTAPHPASRTGSAAG